MVTLDPAAPVDRSPQRIERLRLEHFQNGLRALGLRTKLSWVSTTYTLNILRRTGLWWKTMHCVSKDIAPAGSRVIFKWDWSRTDYYGERALAYLYHGSLLHVAAQFGLSLGLPDDVRENLHVLPSAFSCLRMLPVRFVMDPQAEREGQRPVLTVIAPVPLGESERGLVKFIWPSLDLQYEDSTRYPHIAEYIDLYVEHYLEFGHAYTSFFPSSSDAELLEETV